MIENNPKQHIRVLEICLDHCRHTIAHFINRIADRCNPTPKIGPRRWTAVMDSYWLDGLRRDEARIIQKLHILKDEESDS